MIYLDNAATTYPKPYTVSKAMVYASAFAGGNPGRSAGRMSMEALHLIYSCRERLASLFHIRDPSRIVFTANATHALNLGLQGILRPGDTLVTTELEHNSVLRPAEMLKKNGVNVRYVLAKKSGGIAPEDIVPFLSPPPRLVVLTHASNVTGVVNDIGTIGAFVHSVGALFMVDAAQTAGSIPIDVEAMHIDLLAFPGHKGLLGPSGTGGLYVREGILLKPLLLGGTGTRSLELTQPEEFPERLESGTLNTPGIAGLSAGVAYIQKRGISSIADTEHEALQLLKNGLSQIPHIRILGDENAPRIGALTVDLNGIDCTSVAETLAREYNIVTRGGFHCAPLAHKAMGTYNRGALRFSVGPFTTPHDVTTAAAALQIILEKQ